MPEAELPNGTSASPPGGDEPLPPEPIKGSGASGIAVGLRGVIVVISLMTPLLLLYWLSTLLPATTRATWQPLLRYALSGILIAIGAWIFSAFIEGGSGILSFLHKWTAGIAELRQGEAIYAAATDLEKRMRALTFRDIMTDVQLARNLRFNQDEGAC